MSDAKVETNAAEQAPQTHENKLPGIGAFIAFILAVIMFSGVFAKMPDAYKWLSALDFSTLVGKFGTIVDKANLVGHGGQRCPRRLPLRSFPRSGRDVRSRHD